jgi:arylsulfatase A-like enzyme
MKGGRRILRALLWGSAAGLATLALDQLSAFLTAGLPIPLDLAFILVYAAAGAAVAGLFEAAGYAFRRSRASAFGIVATSSALLYAASVFERVAQALLRPWGATVALAGAVAALAGMVLWVHVLRRIVAQDPGKARSALRPPLPRQGSSARLREPAGERAGGEGDSQSPHEATSYAAILAAVTAALGLAVNRNLVTLPFEPPALAADAAVLGLALALAFGVRSAGPRRTALAAAAVAAAAVLAVAAVVPPFPPARAPAATDVPRTHPDLVLCVVDTLRQDVFRDVVDGTAEGRRFREVLGGAAWFDRAVAVAPWTAPSVASIMTGLYPPEHGFGITVTGDLNRPLTRLSDSVTPLAEHLRAAGYRTVALVTNPLLHPVSGIARGFETFEVLGGPTTKMPLLTILASAGLLRRDYYQDAGAARRRLARVLGGVAGERPLFLWLHLMDPHEPLHRHRGLSPDPRGEELPAGERLYRDETRYALAETTRMIELLGSAGHWPNAVFVLVADHGEMFASDGHGHRPPGNPRNHGHGHALYDELVRVPLVVRPPGGLGDDRRIGVLASHVDLLGTLGDLLGLDVQGPAGERGSLAPWLGSEPPAGVTRGRAYAWIGSNKDGPPQEGVLTESHKLIRFVDGDLPDELFDLESDPGERRNLAGLEPAVHAELAELFVLTRSGLRPPAEGAEPFELDQETRRRLEALGYL